MKTMTMAPAAKASIKPAPASESMAIEGRAALDLYLGKIIQNIEAIEAQLVVFERIQKLQSTLLHEAQSSENNKATESIVTTGSSAFADDDNRAIHPAPDSAGKRPSR